VTLSPSSSRQEAHGTTHGDAPCQCHDARSGQGQGRRAPLDWIPSEIAPNLPQKAGDSAHRSTAGGPSRRAPAARPARLTADEYRAQTAEALERLGAPHRAASLRRCGRVAVVYACDTCGDPMGAVVRPLSCGLRACPDCARLLAADRVRALGAGVDGVAGATRARAVVAQLAAARAELAALERVRHWTEVAPGHRRAAELRDKAARDVGDARWVAARLRELLRGAWGWRLVTISPAWHPEDPAETTPTGLRRRAEALHRAVGELYARRWGCGGLASWSVAVEVSAGGHVHAHALVFGPWMHPARYAAEVSAELGRGVYVDVRRARAKGADVDARSAAREALKYALKGPSPRRAGWVLGESRAEVPSPQLAAAITLGLQRLQLVRHRGPIRDTMRAAAARRAAEPCAELTCASCGARLDTSAGRLESWRAVVAELRRRGEWATAERPRAPSLADRARWQGPMAPERMPARVHVVRGLRPKSGESL
jgi:hypothetical protein